MFNEAPFSLMKRGVILINTARGGIVNTVDFIGALATCIVSGEGLDVYEYEKPIFFHDHSNTQTGYFRNCVPMKQY